jgi:uncharacterized protein GlcG (DUF336 family)
MIDRRRDLLCIDGRLRFFTPETSCAKAVAAAAFRRSTKDMIELHAANPAFWANVTALLEGQALLRIGRVPRLSQGRVIGAMGL